MNLEPHPVPASCMDCSRSCHLKKPGCAYDLALELQDVTLRLQAAGIPAGHAESFNALSEQAAACMQDVVAAVEAENRDIDLARRVANHLRSSPGPRPPRQSPSNPVPSEAGDGDRHSRGNPELYLDSNHQSLEEELLQQEGVYGICTTPKLNVANIDTHVKGFLEPVFQEAPFEGLVAVIPKRHANNPDLVRVTAYYRGPPPTAIAGILKERKERLRP